MHDRPIVEGGAPQVAWPTEDVAILTFPCSPSADALERELRRLIRLRERPVVDLSLSGRLDADVARVLLGCDAFARERGVRVTVVLPLGGSGTGGEVESALPCATAQREAIALAQLAA